MHSIQWKAFILPAALPLTISMTMALAGAGVPFGASPDPAGEQTPGAVSSVRRSTQSDNHPSPTAVSTPPAKPTPTSAPTDSPTSVVVTIPSPLLDAPVPTAGATPRPPATPPPTTTSPTQPPSPTPGPTAPPVATPPPVISSAEACDLARAYVVVEMPTVAVEFKSCTAKLLDGRWEVELKIRNPLCPSSDPNGQACPHHGLTLKVLIYSSDPAIVPADDATRLILQSY